MLDGYQKSARFRGQVNPFEVANTKWRQLSQNKHKQFEELFLNLPNGKYYGQFNVFIKKKYGNKTRKIFNRFEIIPLIE